MNINVNGYILFDFQKNTSQFPEIYIKKDICLSFRKKINCLRLMKPNPLFQMGIHYIRMMHRESFSEIERKYIL